MSRIDLSNEDPKEYGKAVVKFYLYQKLHGYCGIIIDTRLTFIRKVVRDNSQEANTWLKKVYAYADEARKKACDFSNLVQLLTDEVRLKEKEHHLQYTKGLFPYLIYNERDLALKIRHGNLKA